MSHRTTRRTFVKQMTTAGLVLSAAMPPLLRAASPGGKLNVAFVGTGGVAGGHVQAMSSMGQNCPCYADVDIQRQAGAARLFPAAKAYQDYRQMFDQHHREIDAVFVGTPDHHHFPASAIAIQHGKHVYTQKPLTWSVGEARKLTELAARYKVATQMGNQGHALSGWRIVVAWIREGVIGQVKEVHSWSDRPIWPQGLEIGRPQGEDPVPAGFDWDIWVGPAPMRPFKKTRFDAVSNSQVTAYHPVVWRGWFDFGSGAMGDMACHTMDGLFWALDPGHPSSIEPLFAPAHNGETFPKASILKWTFPARGDRPGFDAYWYDGGLMPPRPPELEPDRQLPMGAGNLFIGTKGTIMVSSANGESPRIIPESKMQQIGRPKNPLDPSPGHFEEFVMAARGEKAIDFPKSNFAYAGPMTQTLQLGNVALRVRQKIEWDGQKVTNVPQAHEYLDREPRPGWKVV